MLNCCIERKKARDEGKRGSMSDRSPGGASGDGARGGDHSGDNPEKEFGKSWESWSDSEDEFFECLSDTEDLKGNGQENGKKGAKESGNLKPEGRLHPHGKLMLLHPGEPLYVPITQVREQELSQVCHRMHKTWLIPGIVTLQIVCSLQPCLLLKLLSVFDLRLCF